MTYLPFKFLYLRKSFQYVVLAFILSLSTLVIISLLIRQKISSLEAYSKSIDHSFEVMYKVENLEQLLTHGETGARGFLLTSDSSFLQPYLYMNKAIRPAIADLKATIANAPPHAAGNAGQLSRMRYINENVILQTSILNDLALKHNDAMADMALMKRGKMIMDSLHVKFENMRRFEIASLENSRRQKSEYEELTPAYVNYLLIFSIVLTLASFAYILKELFTKYKYQQELERKVEELNQSNAELEQIAYASSHHLQEPLRKLRLFGSKLLHKYKRSDDEDVKITVERINEAAANMQDLIQNLSDYTILSKPDVAHIETVSLNYVVAQVLHQMQQDVAEKGAEVNIDPLPDVTGSLQRLKLLFKNLLENSLKYSKEDAKPVINIRYRIGAHNGEKNKEEFHIISIEDNGIGFEDVYVEKIFALFNRLHSQQSVFEGKGIGLAICKRVMTNHRGYITASGKVNTGAIFELYFPLH